MGTGRKELKFINPRVTRRHMKRRCGRAGWNGHLIVFCEATDKDAIPKPFILSGLRPLIFSAFLITGNLFYRTGSASRTQYLLEVVCAVTATAP